MGQYFLPHLVVVFIFISAFTLYAQGEFRAYSREEVLSKYKNQLSILRERNESELSKLIDSTNQITASSDVAPFRFEEDPAKSVRLKRQLSIFKGVNDFILGMYIKFDIDDYVFSPTASYPVERFANQAALLSDTTPEELTALMDGVNKLTVLPEQTLTGILFAYESQPRRVVPIFLPIGYPTGSRIGTVLYLISGDTYGKIIANIVTGAQNAYIIQGDTVLISKAASGVPENAVMQALHSMDVASDTAEFTYDGKSYILLTSPGETLSLDTVMVADASELDAAFSGAMRAFMLVTAFVTAVCVALITAFVQSRIKPIRLLRGMLTDAPPSGNELLEIQASVQKLMDQNRDLTNKMEDAITLRGSAFALKFLTGAFPSDDDMLEAAAEVRLNVDTRFYMVGIIAKGGDANYELSPDKLNRLFDNGVSGVTRRLGVEDKAVVIAFADTEEMLADWFGRKFAGIRAVCPGLVMALSAAHTDAAEGARAYLEAEHAFETRFVRGNTTPLRFAGLRELAAESAAQNSQMPERLRQALRSGEAKRVRAALDDIARAMRGMHTSLFVFRCLYNDILSVITEEARSRGGQNEELYSLFTLSQCLSLDDLDAMLHDACTKLISSKLGARKAEASPGMQSAMDAITKRFADPSMSISDIAQALGMGDSRLSVEFKKAYGLTPLECLTASRMRQARRLLRETAMPVKDVALECGYYDISGFNRRFKAYTGLTPQQYRQSGAQEEP